MLPKPVTALALSALISIASFTATSAVAAPNASSDSSISVSAAPPAKGVHHAKKKLLAKKKPHLAFHSVEPKSSPKAEPPKMAASLSTRLELKDTSAKPAHSAMAKHTTLAATGKETFIGRASGHASVAKADKPSIPVVDGAPIASKAPAKAAFGPLHASIARGAAAAKSGRAPARADRAAAKTQDIDAPTDDHPVQVALHGSAKIGVKEAAAAPCMHDAIEFVRGAETERFAVTRCDGASAPLATERLSVLVRPESAAAPPPAEVLAKVKGVELAPGVRRVDPGLLSRIQTITDHFAKPGMPERIVIVSGYRPESKGSFHASGQALDFHLDGVPNEALVDFCKTLDNTGCGYYPNSSFVHVDVRPRGTGHVAWIDTSGPGEAPHYVASWPPPPEADVKVAREDGDIAPNPYTEALPALPVDPRAKVDERAPAATMTTPLRLKDWE